MDAAERIRLRGALNRRHAEGRTGNRVDLVGQMVVIIIIILDLFYMDWPGAIFIYWLKPELIEGLSVVVTVEF